MFFDKPDFPEGKNYNSGLDGVDILLGIIGLLTIAAWIIAGGMVVHGAFTQDLWEFLKGLAIAFVLVFLRKVL